MKRIEPPQRGKLMSNCSFHHEMVRAADLGFHIVTAGEGPTVVLVAGFPRAASRGDGSCRYWLKTTT